MFWLRTHRSRFSALAAAALIPASFVTAPHSVANPGPDEAVAPISDAAAPESAPIAELPPAEMLPADPPPAELPEAPPEALVEHAALLGPGDCPEHGLQVKTILAERAVSALFPQITSMIGVRPDAKPWHPSGRAVDIMIPNPGSAEGIALGDSIRDFALANAGPLGLQDVIWRGTYYTPAGPSGSGYGHFDHVHITTIGGGYATGNEEYVLPVG